jgi:glycosyltransferase involved in cell wall biosynthesis
VAGDVFVHHFGSASHIGTMQKIMLTKNKKLFLKKHLKTSISCCMIVKNEEKNIERCLASALPLFDEIVIVDTGSTDRTLELITGYPNEKIKVFEYKWDNDFSKARNYSLSKATKDWIFVLDADEVLADLDRDMLYPMTTYRYETRNYTNVALYTGNKSCVGQWGEYEQGQYWHPSSKIRLFPNLKEIQFQYPVHEVVEESVYQLGLFINVSPMPVHHYGALDESKEKDETYKELLQKIVEVNPSDIRNLEQLAISSQKFKEWDKAIGIWDKIIDIDKNNIKAWHNKGHALVQKTGDFNEAIKCFKKAMEIDSKDRDAVYNYGYSLFKLGNTSEAEQIADRLCQEHPDFVMGKFLKQLITDNNMEDIANVN